MSLVYVFTGEGKGKTSAALGMVLRAVCAGMKVAWIAWYKDPSWNVSEYKMKELLGVEFIIGGKGFYFPDQTKVKPTKVGSVVDKTDAGTHRRAARNTLAKARELILSGKYDLIVLDEICQAVHEKLVELEDLKTILISRGKTHLVLTGRDCPPELIAISDTATEMKKLKHAYDSGISAVKGLDF